MVLEETPEQAAEFLDSASQMPRVPVPLSLGAGPPSGRSQKDNSGHHILDTHLRRVCNAKLFFFFFNAKLLQRILILMIPLEKKNCPRS